jgi:hypothetical protein
MLAAATARESNSPSSNMACPGPPCGGTILGVVTTHAEGREFQNAGRVELLEYRIGGTEDSVLLPPTVSLPALSFFF